MTKGPPPQAPRPERPSLPPDRIPWREPQPPDTTGASPCAGTRDATVSLVVPVIAERDVVAVPAGGAVRLIADGTVLAVLGPDLGREIVACMTDGWRYAGRLVPVDEHTGHVTLEARRPL